MGEVLDSRMDGASKCNYCRFCLIAALTSGANFGFGHWNAGELGKDDNATPSKGGGKGGKYCNKNSTSCEYYEGWMEFIQQVIEAKYVHKILV